MPSRIRDAARALLPAAAAFAHRDAPKVLEEATGDDFEALGNLRRLATSINVGAPAQLGQLILDLEPAG